MLALRRQVISRSWVAVRAMTLGNEHANPYGIIPVPDTEPFTIRVAKVQKNPPQYKFVEQNDTQELVDVANSEGGYDAKVGRIPRFEYTLEWLVGKQIPTHSFEEQPLIVEVEHLHALKIPTF